MLSIVHYYKDGPFFTSLPSDTIFVLGTNLRGRHGAGSVLAGVRYFGLLEGHVEGRCGQCYAIPTKNHAIKTLPPIKIALSVIKFLAYAREHPELKFLITPIGTGLAGLSDTLIAPMFKDLPENCAVHVDWLPFIAHEQAIDTEL